MILNIDVYNDFELLIREGNPVMVRSYFRTYKNINDLADKVLVWGHYFMVNYLREPSPSFHKEIIKDFFSNKNAYIAAPRGFSKTTVIQLCVAYSVAHNLDKFIVLIEKTMTEASEVIKGVHDEFLSNERILGVYGQMVGKMPLSARVFQNFQKQNPKRAGIDVRNREAMGDVFINGVRIRGKGFNATIRGLKSREWRPTRIILDDVEEDEHIDSPDQRQKYRKNYDKGVQPAVDVGGSIKIFGTILHMDSLLKGKIDQHRGKIYRAHSGSDPSTAPEKSFLWPERWSREQLIQKRDDMISEGKSSNAYAQEYLNDPVSDEERTFKWAWLYESITYSNTGGEKQYRVPKNRISRHEFEKLRKRTTLNGYGLIDAGDSTKSYSDWTGAVVFFVDPNNYRYVVFAERFKLNIMDQLDIVFNMWKSWRSYGLLEVGIEKKAFDDQVKPLLDPEKNRRQAYPIVNELKPMGRNKENRIRGALEGLFESDKVIFVCDRHKKTAMWEPSAGMMQLLEELYNFPNAKNDDLSDSLAYGEDVVVIPFQDQNEPAPHHTPQDDPFEDDIPMQQSPVINHVEEDAFE